jgi:hypothetical protein
MTRTTHYVVKSYFKQGKKLMADQPKRLKSAEDAKAGAER